MLGRSFAMLSRLRLAFCLILRERKAAFTPVRELAISRAGTLVIAGMIIYLTKVRLRYMIALYGHKPHRFLGLAADAEAFNCLRMSFFMLASSFRVGTL
jgi:hypothetical protein